MAHIPICPWEDCGDECVLAPEDREGRCCIDCPSFNECPVPCDGAKEIAGRGE